MADRPQGTETGEELGKTRPHIETGAKPAVRRTYRWHTIAFSYDLPIVLSILLAIVLMELTGCPPTVRILSVPISDDVPATNGNAAVDTSSDTARREVPDQDVTTDLSEPPELEPVAPEPAKTEPLNSTSQVTRIPAVLKVTSRTDCEPYDPEGMTWYRYSKRTETEGQLIVTFGQYGLFTTSVLHRVDDGNKVWDDLFPYTP